MPEERDRFTNGKVRKTAPNVFAASLGYASSQRLRKHNEESVDCSKTVAGLAQLKVRGLAKVRAVLVFALAAYDLVRLPELPDPTGEMCSAGKKEVEMILCRGPSLVENLTLRPLELGTVADRESRASAHKAASSDCIASPDG